MQCSNCEREFAVMDGQFCPYCGSPLYLSTKVKKKKNEELSRSATGDIGKDWNLNAVGVMVIAGFIIVAFSMIATITDLNFFLPVAMVIMAILSPFLFSDSKRCQRCRHLFTTKLVQHKKLSSHQVSQPFYGKLKQTIVLDTYRDRFRCSHCGYEKTRTYSETSKSTIN